MSGEDDSVTADRVQEIVLTSLVTGILSLVGAVAQSGIDVVDQITTSLGTAGGTITEDIGQVWQSYVGIYNLPINSLGDFGADLGLFAPLLTALVIALVGAAVAVSAVLLYRFIRLVT